MLASPITAIATAPSAEVVVMPRLASTPFAGIGEQTSVTKAGKCAVMKPSW